MFKPLHSEEACKKASDDVINEWTKCFAMTQDQHRRNLRFLSMMGQMKADPSLAR